MFLVYKNHRENKDLLYTLDEYVEIPSRQLSLDNKENYLYTSLIPGNFFNIYVYYYLDVEWHVIHIIMFYMCKLFFISYI